VYCCEPDPLPGSYPTLRNATIQATLHHREGRELTTTITAQDTDTEGLVEMESVPIVEIRQGLLDPFTNEFPIENSLHVEYGGDTVSVGGVQAVIEDYEALDIRLERAED